MTELKVHKKGNLVQYLEFFYQLLIPITPKTASIKPLIPWSTAHSTKRRSKLTRNWDWKLLPPRLDYGYWKNWENKVLFCVCRMWLHTIRVHTQFLIYIFLYGMYLIFYIVHCQRLCCEFKLQKKRKLNLTFVYGSLLSLPISPCWCLLN